MIQNLLNAFIAVFYFMLGVQLGNKAITQVIWKISTSPAFLNGVQLNCYNEKY